MKFILQDKETLRSYLIKTYQDAFADTDVSRDEIESFCDKLTQL